MKRLAKRDRKAAAAIGDTLTLLRDNAFDPKLATHKLKGNLSGYWACSAGYDLRIVFEMGKQNDVETILLIALGDHNEVY